MKIYTRGGDDGSTALYGGPRVSKADARVEAYGAVDELNAVLGWVRAAGPSEHIDTVLGEAQDACFRVGAWLASAPGRDPGVVSIREEDVDELEAAVDAMDPQLEPLKRFILPGGCEVGARLHVARTVCRRAERRVVALAAIADVDPLFVRWTNRLSDLLFVQARWANQRAGAREIPWHARKD